MERNKATNSLGTNQCAYCQEKLHWEGECPRNGDRNILRKQPWNVMVEWGGDLDEE